MTDYKYYIDAIGLSWDSGYTIGDNLNEGLLLSFNKNMHHKWINYTIDGVNSLNIMGNTTIPMLPDGNYFVQVFYEDFSGEIIQSEINYFSIDTSPPEIQINTPGEYSLFGKPAPTFSISVLESNLHNTWYSLDGGITKYVFLGLTQLIDQVEWNKFGNGTVVLRVYANDTGGHENYTEITLRKDILSPEIIVYAPLADEFSKPPSFNLSIFDPNGLDSTWYSLDGGLTNFTFTGSLGHIDNDAWKDLPTGLITIRFYARDSLGNEGYVEALVVKVSQAQQVIPGYEISIIIGLLGFCFILLVIKSKK